MIIAEVAARRARRAAAQAIYRYRGSTKLDAICRAYGASSLHELTVVALDRSVDVFCSPTVRSKTVAELKKSEGAIARALARAEKAAALQFDAFGTPVSFLEDGHIDWTLDPISGHHYPMVASSAHDLHQEGRDPKYPWVFGRLDHLVALAQGYWVTNDPAEKSRYAQLFVEYAKDFIEGNPVGVGVQWTCTMEVALRAANLAIAMRMFADAKEAREPSFVGLVLTSLTDHGIFIEANLEDTGRVPNNHLVSDHVGLLVSSLLFPELPGAVERIALAINALKEQVVEQVHPDGWSFEGSVPYHRLATELFSLAWIVAQQSNVDLGAQYEERLRAMFHVARSYCSKKGLAPQIGDNDSGRIFALTTREVNDHGYLGSLGAALFTDSTLKANEPLCDEAIWLLGQKGAQRYARLEALFKPESRVSETSGIHVLRNDDAVVTISAGKNGQKGLGGHSHNDKLAFELHLDGAPLIVDPGTGVYTRSHLVRNAFRSTRAHATVEIDAEEQAPLDKIRLFLLEDRANCQVTRFDANDQRKTLVARHSAFDGIEVERHFELSEHALVVSDLLKGTGVHTVVSRFPLPDTEARIRPMTDAERARVVVATGEKLSENVVELGPVGSPRAVLCFSEDLRASLEPAPYSPGYGQIVPSVCVNFAVRARLPRALTVCVLWG